MVPEGAQMLHKDIKLAVLNMFKELKLCLNNQHKVLEPYLAREMSLIKDRMYLKKINCRNSRLKMYTQKNHERFLITDLNFRKSNQQT